jgi:hypothetical protein
MRNYVPGAAGSKRGVGHGTTRLSAEGRDCMKQAAGLLTSPLPDGLPIRVAEQWHFVRGLQQRRLSRNYTGFPFKVAPHRGNDYQLRRRR